MKPEIIVIDGTDDDDDENTSPNVELTSPNAEHVANDENTSPNVEQPSADTITGRETSAGDEKSSPTACAGVAPLAAPNVECATSGLATVAPQPPVEECAKDEKTSEDKAGQAQTAVLLLPAHDSGSPAGIPFSTDFSHPARRRYGSRGLVPNLQAPAPKPKKRRSDTRLDQAQSAASDGLRQTRLSTMLVRSQSRLGRLFDERRIVRPPPLRPSRKVQPITMTPSTHFMSVGEESLVPVRWPGDIVPLGDHFNPDKIRFQDLPIESMCSCEHPCRVNTCSNARSYIFCDVYSCPFAGLCGNGLEPSRCLGLMKNATTNEFTVAVTDVIDKDVVVGEYLGKMKLEAMPVNARPKNTGFRLYMHQDPEHEAGARVCIDARDYGNMLRFVNHSCFANARFRQVHNGTEHTVVMVTNRRLERGEELLVDYGSELWFLCRCNGRSCRHAGSTFDANDADDEMGDECVGPDIHEEKSAALEESDDFDADADDDSDFE